MIQNFWIFFSPLTLIPSFERKGLKLLGPHSNVFAGRFLWKQNEMFCVAQVQSSSIWCRTIIEENAHMSSDFSLQSVKRSLIPRWKPALPYLWNYTNEIFGAISVRSVACKGVINMKDFMFKWASGLLKGWGLKDLRWCTWDPNLFWYFYC